MSAIAFLAVILGAKTFAIGCGDSPAPGEEGGTCKDDGCHTYCARDLRCDNSVNKCVAGPTSGNGGYVPSAQCSALIATGTCPGAIEWRCSGGAAPARTCTLASENDAGVSAYCCAPQCTVATENRVCGSPGFATLCDDPLSPADSDASLTCLTIGTSSSEHLYCCAPPDTCFAMDAEQLLPCESGSEQYFCSGDAPPSSASLRCTAVQGDAGSALRGYCCEAVDGGSDGGANEGGED